eukprot:Platyproteum_vivax@DN5343_c0_g1_i1.p1
MEEWEALQRELDDLAQERRYYEAQHLQNQMIALSDEYSVRKSPALQDAVYCRREQDSQAVEENFMQLATLYDKAKTQKLNQLKNQYERLFRQLEDRHQTEFQNMRSMFKIKEHQPKVTKKTLELRKTE